MIPAQTLKIDDLNSVIKYFATQITQKIKQLQEMYRPEHRKKNRTYQQSLQISSLQPQQKKEDKSQNQITVIIEKYRNYILKEDIEIQYLRKFNHRILQIFGFYKLRSKNQSILNHAERQLANKLNIFINNPNLKFVKVMQYIVSISKKGFINLNNRACSNNSTIIPNHSASANPTPVQDETKKISKTISKDISKDNVDKNNERSTEKIREKNKIFQRNKVMGAKYGNKEFFVQGNDHYFSKGDYNFIRKKRAVSVMSSYGSTPSAKAQPVANTQTTMKILENLYSCLDFDKVYLQRCIDSQNYVQREQLKRNKSMLKKNINFCKERSLHNSSRKMKTENTAEMFDSKALQDLSNRSKNTIYFENEGVKKAPFMVFGQKRRKIKTSHKRRNYESQNINKQNCFT